MKSVKGKVMNLVGLTELVETEESDLLPEASSVNQRENLIKRYGVKMDLPAFYYYYAQFVPHMPNHLVTMAFHAVPEGEEVVQTIFQDGTVKDESFTEIYKNYGDQTILTLYETYGRKGLKNLREIMLKDMRKSVMKFSRSGKFLAIIKKYSG